MHCSMEDGRVVKEGFLLGLTQPAVSRPEGTCPKSGLLNQRSA
jgi:hypothetical protein